MKRGNKARRGLALLMAVVVVLSSGILPTRTVNASIVNITVEDFSKLVVKQLNLTTVSGSEENKYSCTLIATGIIKENEFSAFTDTITRGDAMVLLNRADEYLYGNTTDSKLVQTVIEKRISDIKKAALGKREDIAKAFLKGYMKGYSNGTYCTNRNLKLTSKLTAAGAKSCVKLLTDKKSRAKISPDGQLIRTTNLPISYKKWPYILASYPNSYYDWKLYYEIGTTYKISDDKKIPYENLVDYAAPVNVDNVKGRDNYYTDFGTIREENLDLWVNKAQTYLEHVFSVNYKTIDNTWVEEVMKTDYSYGYGPEEGTRKELNRYVTDMKANKTIVEYSKIRVDGSSLYYYNDSFYLRAYVKYRIVSSNVKYGVDTDTLIKERPYNDILWSDGCLVDFTDFTIGKWRECGYDIAISTYYSEDDKGVSTAYLNEYYCKQYQITK